MKEIIDEVMKELVKLANKNKIINVEYDEKNEIYLVPDSVNIAIKLTIKKYNQNLIKHKTNLINKWNAEIFELQKEINKKKIEYDELVGSGTNAVRTFTAEMKLLFLKLHKEPEILQLQALVKHETEERNRLRGEK